MLTIFHETTCGKRILLLVFIICSNIIQARRYVVDTLPDTRNIQVVESDSTSRHVFSPSASNGKEAASGSVVFGVVAIFLDTFSLVSRSVNLAVIAYICSIGALVFALVSAIRSRKRGNRIPFSSLKEYKDVRKKARTGAILAALGLVIALICIAAFFTFTFSLL
jgi:amino acid permease